MISASREFLLLGGVRHSGGGFLLLKPKPNNLEHKIFETMMMAMGNCVEEHSCETHFFLI
jgi:hypothetical protein